MSDQWLYRIYGQEFGPVSLDLVRTLVVTGAIAPDDEVRCVTRSNWILACAATELRDSIDSHQGKPTVERRVDRDDWFCRGYAGEYGPLTLSDLIQLAANGELQPDEEIRSRADEYWRQVCSIQRLVDLLPFSEPSGKKRRIPTSVELADELDSEQVDVIPFPGARTTTSLMEDRSDDQFKPNSSGPVRISPEAAAPAQSPSSITADENSAPAAVNSPIELQTVPFTGTFTSKASSPSAEPTTSDLWTGWIAGEEFGPVNYTELLLWAVTGRLAPTDFVRKGDEGQYVPAVHIPCLFTVRAAANSLSGRVGNSIIKIADEPANLPERNLSKNNSNPPTTIGSASRTPEPAVTRKTSIETRLSRTITTLCSFARTFTKKNLNQNS